MMNFNSNFGLGMGWHIHAVFGGILLLGAILFTVWTIKTLNKKELQAWATWLLAIGVIGVLLTGNWGMRGWNMMHGGNNANFKGMFQHMQEDDHADINNADDFREHMLKEMGEHMDI